MKRDNQVRDEIALRRAEYTDWLVQACSIRSVADEPQELARMFDWLRIRFMELGAQVKVLTQPGSPDFLLARFGSSDPEVLLYNHYDVQSPEPVTDWKSDPFKPLLEDGVLYARGVADNKGTLLARVAAVDFYQRFFGEIPVTMKFLVEGEEETGSNGLEELVKSHSQDLKASGCLWEGTGLDHAGRPKFVFGAKGLLCVELNLTMLNDDQHSSLSVYAPSAPWRLSEALLSLRSPDGRILIDGFYEDVVEPSPEDLDLLTALDFDELAERQRLGVDSFIENRSGFEFQRNYFFSPSCNIARLSAGFPPGGPFKTILPRSASANIDFRLVPDQSPSDVMTKLNRHLRRRGFEDVKTRLVASMRPLRSPVDSEIGRSSVAAARTTFDHQPIVQPLMIGAGPLHPVATTLDVPIVSPPGVNRPSSNVHAANENCRIEDFLRIIEHTVMWIRGYVTTR